MPGGDTHTLYVLTLRGERGPYDRTTLKELLSENEIRLDDQVRNAFGRQLGTVGEIIRSRVSSGRLALPHPPVAVTAGASVPAHWPTALIVLVVALAIISIGITIALLARSPTAPAPRVVMPVPLAAPAAPTPPAPATPAVVPTAPKPRAEILPGILVEFFTFDDGPEDIPDLSGLTPMLRWIESSVDVSETGIWPSTSLRQHFAMRASGLLRIATAGTYTFAVSSDDGSRLLIDNACVVDHGGLHPMNEMSRSLRLAAGDHQLVLLYFQNIGALGCRLAWWSDSMPRRAMDERELFHHRDQQLDD